MEYCEAGDLLKLIKTLKRQDKLLSLDQTKTIFKQLIEVINYLHLNRICHRDIKPENVWIINNCGKINIKLIDFGLATSVEEDTAFTDDVGTTLYMAPEVINKNYDEQCDIWSSGVILYFMLTNKQWFRMNSNDDDGTIRNEILKFNPEQITEFTEEINFLLQNILTTRELRLTANDLWYSKLFTNTTNTDSNPINRNPHAIKLESSYWSNFENLSFFHKSIYSFVAYHLSSSSINQEYIDLFKSIDIDKDGALSSDDLQEYFNQDDSPVNIKNNILISFNTFIAVMVLNEHENSFNHDGIINEIFNFLDIDNTGFVSLWEIFSLFSPKNSSEETEIKQCFKCIDKDNKGYIEFNEFALYI